MKARAKAKAKKFKLTLELTAMELAVLVYVIPVCDGDGCRGDPLKNFYEMNIDGKAVAVAEKAAGE